MEAAAPGVGETADGRTAGAGEEGGGQCHSTCRSHVVHFATQVKIIIITLSRWQDPKGFVVYHTAIV